jgi:predicted alpha/beta-fold hydrolase
MPYIAHSTYRARGIFRNAHINTIYPALFRQVEGVHYERERVETPDGDFLDLDWSARGAERLLLLLHGLEGNSQRHYVRGMARYFNQQGWDALALNFRGCSGEPNRRLRSYHIGETSDLGLVVRHVLSLGRYRALVLVGFSLGGNVALKYLGEQPAAVPPEVKAAVAFSVPCEVVSANAEIDKWQNWPYRQRFMKSLNAKIVQKARLFPGQLSLPAAPPRDFKGFDGMFTAPIHGFGSAEDYWRRNSSLQFLPAIERPALLVNARDDTFLSPACYPVGLAEKQRHLYLETPRWGGHVGFVSQVEATAYWPEKRAYEFVEAIGL